MSKYICSAKPDAFDEKDNDYLYGNLIKEKVITVPDKVDLRNKINFVYMQTHSDCTANAGTANKEILDNVNDIYSRLFLYNRERITEGTLDKDEGAQSRTIGDTLKTYGICLESEFPYVDSNLYIEPSKEAYESAQKHKITSYHRILNSDEIELALSQGHPVLFSCKVYSSFENKVGKDGFIPMPDEQHEELEGYHETLLVGFDKTKSKNMCCLKKIFNKLTGNNRDKYYILKNSWGDWGDKGYGYLPYDVFERIKCDIWVLIP